MFWFRFMSYDFGLFSNIWGIINDNLQNKVLTLSSSHRKCDLLDCQKNSPLWRVFLGCGHSFHVECTLPDISVCRICQSTLLTAVETLGQTANDAVLRDTDYTNTGEDDDEDTSTIDEENETSDCDEFYKDQPDEQEESTTIDALLQRISLW